MVFGEIAFGGGVVEGFDACGCSFAVSPGSDDLPGDEVFAGDVVGRVGDVVVLCGDMFTFGGAWEGVMVDAVNDGNIVALAVGIDAGGVDTFFLFFGGSVGFFVDSDGFGERFAG